MDEIYNTILAATDTQGLWATLSMILIFYITKSQKERDTRQDSREENYQKLVFDLTNKLSILTSIEKCVDDIYLCMNSYKENHK